MKHDGVHVDCAAWKIKVPLKIKIFLCYLKQWATLTKDNLTKRNDRKGSIKCCFCSSDETIQHFFLLPYGKTLLEYHIGVFWF